MTRSGYKCRDTIYFVFHTNVVVIAHSISFLRSNALRSACRRRSLAVAVWRDTHTFATVKAGMAGKCKFKGKNKTGINAQERIELKEIWQQGS